MYNLPGVFTIGIIFGVAGWVVIEFVLFLLSFVSISIG